MFLVILGYYEVLNTIIGVVDIVTPYISNQQLEYQHYFCSTF